MPPKAAKHARLARNKYWGSRGGRELRADAVWAGKQTGFSNLPGEQEEMAKEMGFSP